MRLKQVTLLVCCLLLLPLAGHAQVNQPTPASREDILRLIDALQIKKTMETLALQIKAQAKSIATSMRPADSPPPDAAEQAFLDSLMDDLMKEYTTDDVMADVIPIYQKYYTKEDVDRIVAFYTSPTGKKLLEKSAAMGAEIVAATQEKTKIRMQALMKRTDERIKEYLRNKHERDEKESDSKK